MNTAASRQAYEVRNPSFPDMNLEQQIEAGINDWCAERRDGHQFFGESKAKAEAARDDFEMQAAADEYEAELWNDEMAQLSWAERGGYAAGLARPASRFDRFDRARTDRAAVAQVCDMNEDIPF